MAKPFFLHRLLLKKPKHRIVAEGDAAILAVKSKLEKPPFATYSQELLKLIEQRKQDYTAKIKVIENKADQQMYIVAYVHFAQNLRSSFEKRIQLVERMDEYYGSNHYCHVGRVVTDGKSEDVSYGFADQLASHLIKLGILAIIISALALTFSMPISLIAIGIAVCTLLSGIFYASTVTQANERRVKEVELNLFGEADRVLASAVIDESLNEQAQTKNFP